MKKYAKAYAWAEQYLFAVLFSAFCSGCVSVVLIGVGVGLSESANWILPIAHVPAKVNSGYTTALSLPFFVRFALSGPYEKNQLSNLRTAEKLVVTVMVSLGFILIALFIGYLVRFRFSYSNLLGMTFFVFCYSELVAGRRVFEAST